MVSGYGYAIRIHKCAFKNNNQHQFKNLIFNGNTQTLLFQVDISFILIIFNKKRAIMKQLTLDARLRSDITMLLR